MRKRKEKYERLALVARALSGHQNELDAADLDTIKTPWDSMSKKVESIYPTSPEFAQVNSETADTPKANRYCSCRDEELGTDNSRPFTL